MPANEQGELEGTLTSLVSVTFIGLPLITNLFAYFTSEATHIYFPGAPFLLGAMLTLISVILAIRSLTAHPSKTKVIDKKMIIDD